MEHLFYKLRFAAFGVGMLMLFFLYTPAHADNTPIPTFRPTSPYNRIGSTIDISATKIDPNSIGHQTYHSTIYTPFGDGTPSSNNPAGSSGSGGSGDSDDDVGIPGWADTPSEPLPIGDTAPLFLFAAAMIAIIWIRQRRQQIKTQSTNTSNNNDTMHNTRYISSNRLQKLFLLLVFVCFVGQTTAQTVYVKEIFQYSDKKGNLPTNFSTLLKGAYGYQGAYCHGTFYISDGYKGNGKKIYSITIPASTSTKPTVQTNTRTHYTQWGTCADDYGNLIVNSSSSSQSVSQFQIYQNGDLSTTPKTVTLSSPISGQTDFLSAKGNLWSGTGYLYLFPANSNKVIILEKNDNSWSRTTRTSLSTTSAANGGYVIPIAAGTTRFLYQRRNENEDNTIKGGFFLYDGSNQGQYLSNTYSTTQPSNNSTFGGAVFKIGTQELFVHPSGSNYNGGWTLRKLDTKDDLYSQAPIGDQGYGSGGAENASAGEFFTVEKVNDYSVNLYMYCQANGIAAWTISGLAAQTYNIATRTTGNYTTGGGGGTFTVRYTTPATSTTTTTTTTSSITSGTYNVLANTSVTLTATAASGYKFKGWYNGSTRVSTDATYSYTVSSTNTIQARFQKVRKKDVRIQTYNGSSWIVSNTGGYITFKYNNGQDRTVTIDNSNDPNSYTDVFEGTTFTCTAYPKNSYTFIGWWNNSKGQFTDNPWTATADNTTDQSITARFAQCYTQTPRVTFYDPETNTYKEGNTGGTVTINYDDGLGKSSGKDNKTATVSNTDSYRAIINSTVTLTATPKSGYVFIGWYKGDEHLDWAKDNTCSFIADNAYNITARFTKPITQNFKIQTYESTAYADGGNGGTVGISYNNGLSKTVNNSTTITDLYQGHTVTLTANAAAGYKFIGWFNYDFTTEYAKGSNTYTYRGEGGRTVYARFRKTYNQAINIATYSHLSHQYEQGGNGGSVSISYNDGSDKTTTATNSSTVTPLVDTDITLTAIPTDGFEFAGWFDGANPVHGEMEHSYHISNSDKVITARFQPTETLDADEYVSKEFRIQTYNDGSDGNLENNGGSDWQYDGGGTIKVTYNYDQTFDWSSSRFTVMYKIQEGSIVYLQATPNSGYTFIGWWNQGCKTTDINYAHPATMGSDPSITARFAHVHTQTIQSEGNGPVYITYDSGTSKDKRTGAGSYKALKNTPVTVEATSTEDYTFLGWFDKGGTLKSAAPSYTYQADNDYTLVARFKTNHNKLTVSVLNYNPEHEKFEEYGYEYNTITLTQGSTELKKSYSSFSHTFNEATTVTLTAAPEDDQVTGYNFSGWYINNEKLTKEGSNSLYTLESDDSKVLTINLSGEVAIQARFAPKNCNILKLKYNIGGTYTIRYSKNEQFNPASTKESSLTEDTYTHFSLIQQTGEKYYFDVTAIQPIHGYIYKEGKLGSVTIQLGGKTSRGNDGNVTFRANFVRKDDQVVYLNVENANAGSDWLPAAQQQTKYYAYLYNPYTADKLWLEMTPISEKLFTCTIPGDNYTELRFVHSTNLDLHGSTTMTVEQLQDNHQYLKRSTVQTIPATRYNCYKILGGWNHNQRVDAWTTRPTTTGDYRILYIEQTGGEIDYTFDKCDVVTKHTTPGTYQDIVSLHIYNKVVNGVNGTNNPEIILQRWNGTEWQDLERHMIFGNNGITNINAAVNDEDHACGVWNFTIQQIVAQGGDVTATILLGETKKYTGNYYIRTANATGGYNNFTHPENIISYSEYAKNHSDYSHYFIRHIDINEDGSPSTTPGTHKHIAFTIANDYAMFLNHELMVDNPLDKRFFPEGETDIFVDNPLYDNGQPTNAPNLPADATVRFGWDIRTNRLTRAYIADTKLKNNEYLVIEGTNITDTLGNALQPQGETTYFNDNSNYLYSIDLTAKANAALKVKARLNGQYQYFMGTDQEGEPLISGNGANTYPIRLLYDFKDDRFTTVYRPKTALSGTIDLETPVMIERVHNDAPTQITFENNATINNAVSGTFDQPAYAVMTFLESVLASVDKTHHEKMFYWISFPFDVCIRDVFGLGDYGKYWIMEEYDGEQRAKDGLAKSNWKYITKKSAVLEKNKGYVLCLNYSQILQDKLFSSYNSDDSNLNNGKLSLYFPSVEAIDPASIKENPEAYIYLPEYKTANTAWNHWNWHIIGVPSFADPEFIDIQTDIPFVYQYWHPGDAYAAVSINDINFHAMHAYMVQYTGGLSWTKIVNTTGSVTPKSLAAKTDEEADKKVMLRLELQQAGSTLDKTYVQLRNDKGTKGFDMSLDLTKIINAGANIYSIVDNHEMAGNAIPKDETVLPLGVVITAAGEYTFAMPQGTEGMIVELIDYEQGTSTNLLAGDYTVNMPVGTNNTRFALRLVPEKVATSVEDITGGSNDNVRKLLIDGVLYLVTDDAVYNTQGKLVK